MNDRRRFWEMCASRTPDRIYSNGEERDLIYEEDPDDIARWADHMLIEWDKRWDTGDRSSGSLNFEELFTACRNVGVNLECGACAEQFYTGHITVDHDSHCWGSLDKFRRDAKR